MVLELPFGVDLHGDPQEEQGISWVTPWKMLLGIPVRPRYIDDLRSKEKAFDFSGQAREAREAQLASKTKAREALALVEPGFVWQTLFVRAWKH